MTTLRPSKALSNALSDFERELFREGYFPEVQFKDIGDSGFRGFSFSLFEYQHVSRLLFKCLDKSMIKAGIEYGAFSRKHGEKFIQSIKEKILSNMKPVTSEWLKDSRCVGNGICLWGIEEKFKFREGKIIQKLYSDIIFDIETTDANGYFAETGSAYIWEIAMIEIDSVWHPFHLSEEEKQTRKEINGR